MSFSVTVTLNTIVGTPGPFSLYTCTGATCSGTPFVTGVTLTSLQTGYTSSSIPNGTTDIKILSTGVSCSYEKKISISGIPTPSPTPTPIDVPIGSTYYYYSLGDCANMRYSGVQTTNFGFGAPLQLTVCMTEAQISEFYSTMNWAQQSLSIDYNNPCGFGTGFSGTYIGRSVTQLTEGDVYTYDGACYAIVELDPLYVTSYNFDMSTLGEPNTGFNPCGSCSPPFTGYTIVAYSGTTCDTGENIMAYTIFGGLTLGNTYGIQYYSGNTLMADPRCATLTHSLGEQFVLTDPTAGINGYSISDAGPITLGGPAFPGYANCTACNATPKKYYVAAERCDTNQYGLQIWVNSPGTVSVGDSILTSFDSHCWTVTQADQYRTVVYLDLGTTITSTGCVCGSGGGNPLPSEWSLTSGSGDGATVCGDYTSPSNRTTIYADPSVSALANGVHLYYSWSPLVNVSDGWVSNGTNYWTITNGILSAQTACPALTSYHVTNLQANIETFDDQGGVYAASTNCEIKVNHALTANATFNVSMTADGIGVQTFDVLILAGANIGTGGGGLIGVNQTPTNATGCINSITSADTITYTGYGC